MKFTFARNHLPDRQPALNVGGLMNMLNTEMLVSDGDQIAVTRSIYQVDGARHCLVGLWRSENRECGIAVTQAVENTPEMTLSMTATVHRKQNWYTKRIWPAMLCLEGTGPFMLQTVLHRLEVFDEMDPDLYGKLVAAWAELKSRYQFGGWHQLARITSFSYRRGLKHESG